MLHERMYEPGAKVARRQPCRRFQVSHFRLQVETKERDSDLTAQT